MPALPDNLKTWVKCVQQAKAKNSKSSSYGFIQGKVLKDAQKCYCAMG